MRVQRINHSKLFIAIILTFSLSMVIILSNRALAAAPDAATLIAPEGTIFENTPTYAWNAVPGATSYRLLVKEGSAIVYRKWYTAAAAGCESGSSALCSVTPNKVLGDSSHRWWIQTYNPDGYGPNSWGLSFSVEEKGSKEASIAGTYAFTGMEQGGAPSPASNPVVQEAAMGIAYLYGDGSGIGKISWNMYDLLDQVPGSDRLVLHRFPFSMEYTLDADGFGTMTGYIDFDLDTVTDAEIAGKIVVTKTNSGEAIEFWFIGENPLSEGIVMIHFFKREL